VGRRIVWTPESRWWLREIYEYIKKDKPATAVKVVRRIYEKAHVLLDFPELGHVYEPARVENVRILVYGHYRIVYKLADSGEVFILGVFHGALDLRRHLTLK
jgi:plasmid stabilization system protein ParE